MAKPRKSVKLTAGKRNQLQSALDLARSHYAALAEVWPELPPEQRMAVLNASPILAALVGFGEQFRRV
jgi:hypothetical protein